MMQDDILQLLIAVYLRKLNNPAENNAQLLNGTLTDLERMRNALDTVDMRTVSRRDGI